MAASSARSIRVAERQVGLLAADGPADVDGQDVLGPLPDGVALGVAELAGDRPVVHVAVAAEDLERALEAAHRATRVLRILASGMRIRRSRRASSGSAAPRSGAGALEGDGEPGLEVDQEVDQRLAHQRVAVDALAPLGATGRVDGRLEEGAPVDAEAHERDPEAAGVHHLHHPVDAPPVAGRARWSPAVSGLPPASQARAPSRCTSPVGTPTVPELGLQALDHETVR